MPGPSPPVMYMSEYSPWGNSGKFINNVSLYLVNVYLDDVYFCVPAHIHQQKVQFWNDTSPVPGSLKLTALIHTVAK